MNMKKYTATTVIATLGLALTACYHGHHKDLRFGARESEMTDSEKALKAKIEEDLANPSPVDVAFDRTIDTKKQTRIILQVDGGGIMGLTPAIALAELEKTVQERSGKRLKDITSIMSGTSTGAIITGLLAAGVTAENVKKFYVQDGVRLFKSTGRYPTFPVRPMYSRPKFQERIIQAMCDAKVSPTITLGQMPKKPQIIIPAYDLSSRRTHFFSNLYNGNSTSYSESMKGTFLADAISASALSAPLFFGKLSAPSFVWEHLTPEGQSTHRIGAVFQDGGQGTQNNTLGILLLLALSQGWAAEGQQLVIISFGTGGDFSPRSYQKAALTTGLGQILDFKMKDQARNESILLQWRAARLASQVNRNVKVYRFDYAAGKGSSAFSARLADDYIEAGHKIAKRKEFIYLADQLAQLNSVKVEGLKSPQVGAPPQDDASIKSLIQSALQSTNPATTF
jgi:hypothetical protein